MYFTDFFSFETAVETLRCSFSSNTLIPFLLLCLENTQNLLVSLKKHFYLSYIVTVLSEIDDSKFTSSVTYKS